MPRERRRKQPEGITLEEKNKQNIWDSIDAFIEVLDKMRDGDWVWYLNSRCKYVDLRVDMRDGGCLMMIDDGNFKGNKIRIDPTELAFQYGKSEDTVPAKEAIDIQDDPKGREGQSRARDTSSSREWSPYRAH